MCILRIFFGFLYHLFFDNFSEICNIVLATGAIIAIFQTRKIQKKNDEPKISLSFYAIGSDYRLECENTGNSGVKDLKIRLIDYSGTKNNISFSGGCYKNNLTLYPNEKVCSSIGKRFDDDDARVFLQVTVSYTDCSTGKKIKAFERDVIFSDFGRDDDKNRIFNAMTRELDEISRSNNRMANYLEGRWLFKNDEVNVMPNGSLYQDIRDAVNDRKSDNVKSPKELSEKIKKEQENNE